MDNKLTSLQHLRMAVEKIKVLIGSKADKGHTHTAEDVGAATMGQVNDAIDAAIAGAINASY